MSAQYTQTTGQLAREGETTNPTIISYANAGLLDYIVASTGIRLFRAGQAERVKQIRAERMASRGNRKR